MPTIPTWNPELGVGNPHLDDQHRRLLALSVRACDLHDGAPGLRGEFHEILNDLTELTNRHFIDEEMVLARNHCPSLAAHKQEHEKIRDQLIDLMWNAEQGRLNTAALREMLQGFFGVHLLETDLPAKAFMKARR